MKEELYRESLELIPGGVNSPVRALKSVEGEPIYIEKSEGAYLFDTEGNKYIDFISSWGPIIHGHNDKDVKEAIINQVNNGLTYGLSTELEIKLAKKIKELAPHIDMIRLTSSGTEACMATIRLARAITKRNKIIKFEGCYHGHSDSLLVKAGSALLTEGIIDSNGLTEGTVKDTITFEYNNIEKFEEYIMNNEVAAVIVEPVAANMGLVLPKENFLEKLRKLTKKTGALLIFDEVITGFRIGRSGASGYFGIDPDLVCYGKIIGGGMPLGAFAGKKEYMKEIAPSGNVYHAGTMSGNPICVIAGITALEKLNDELYKNIKEKGIYLLDKIRNLAKEKKLNISINNIESLFTVFFGVEKVENLTDAMKIDNFTYKKYWNHMRKFGIIIPPSQYEACFLNGAHTYDDLDNFYKGFESFVKENL